MNERDDFLQRLDAVEGRLASLASASTRPDALTEPDPGTGERWDAGQVWAHLAEFVPYWVDQLRIVIGAADDEPMAFGRTKTDEGRVAAIARDRSLAIAVLWSQTLSDIEMLRHLIVSLDERAFRARGLHPTLGVMVTPRILNEFLIGHLEQHAEQLSGLVAENAS